MYSKKLLVNILIIVILVTLLTSVASARQEIDSECTILGVTSGSTADGSCMTTHTDDSGTDTFHVNMVSAADHEPGSMRTVLKNTDMGPYAQLVNPIVSPGEIPQVSHTYAYTNASYSFQNEMQVGMGESTVSGRREMRNTDGWFDIVELERIALERASTAREAVQIMGTLAEEYGYYIGGECITVIDPDEVWVFEIYGPGALWKPGSKTPGCVWVAQRVPDGEIFVCANRSRIGEVNLDETDNFMASPNIFSLAEQMGLWSKDSGEPFKIYETYGYKNYSTYNARREWRVFDLVAPSLKLNPWMKHYPFSVKPDNKITAQDIMAINRDHYEGTEFDLTKGLAAGPFGTPNRYPTPGSVNPEGSDGWERAISLFRTNFSTVVVARKGMPSWVGGLTWFAYDAPHSSCYFPIYCSATELPESFKTGMRGGSYDVFSRESAWWAFNFVSNWADLKYSYMIEDIKTIRDPLEAEFFAVQPAIEKTALDLYKQDPELARTFLTTYTNSCATRVVDAYWKLASQLVGRYADGYVHGDDTFKLDSVGYPKEWLDAVDFGKSTIAPEGYPK